MGDDPKKSVLNRFNQVHDAKNIFVTDGACFVTQGCYEPTLTIMAISAARRRTPGRRVPAREPCSDEPGKELSRRMWLLRLGSGALLAGCSGIDLPAADPVKLPPGLYQPSIDHLAHVLKPASNRRAAIRAAIFRRGGIPAVANPDRPDARRRTGHAAGSGNHRVDRFDRL